MAQIRARWLLWLPVPIVIVWIAAWIACEEYRHARRQEAIRAIDAIRLEEGSLGYWVMTPGICRRFARLAPRPLLMSGYGYQPAFGGTQEFWLLQYATNESEEAVFAAAEEFALSHGYTKRANWHGRQWSRTDSDGEWLLSVETKSSRSKRLVECAQVLYRKEEPWYERARGWIIPSPKP